MSALPSCAAVTGTLRRTRDRSPTVNLSISLIARHDGDGLRMPEEIRTPVDVEIEPDIALGILERQHGAVLGPLPVGLDGEFSLRDLARMPAVLVDQEDVLGLRDEIERGYL